MNRCHPVLLTPTRGSVSGALSSHHRKIGFNSILSAPLQAAIVGHISEAGIRSISSTGSNILTETESERERERVREKERERRRESKKDRQRE